MEQNEEKTETTAPESTATGSTVSEQSTSEQPASEQSASESTVPEKKKQFSLFRRPGITAEEKAKLKHEIGKFYNFATMAVVSIAASIGVIMISDKIPKISQWFSQDISDNPGGGWVVIFGPVIFLIWLIPALFMIIPTIMACGSVFQRYKWNEKNKAIFITMLMILIAAVSLMIFAFTKII